jgi:hypothetical protein
MRDSDDFDRTLVRIVEGWFVPPQTGTYVFHASCDDSCSMMFSSTDKDTASATNILTVGWNGWRNFYDPTPSSISSTEQSLEAAKHYYFKVTHSEIRGNDYMTVGFTIKDTSNSHPNSLTGWKSVSIDAHHTFEVYKFVLPNNTDAKFRLQFSRSDLNCNGFAASSDVFTCDTSKDQCP